MKVYRSFSFNFILIGTALLLGLCLVSTSSALDIQGTLPFESEPVEQWAVVFDGGRPKLLPARAVKSLKSISVTGSAEALPPSTYVAVAASYVDGTVKSTPVVKLGHESLSGEGAARGIEEKRSLLAQKTLRVEELDGELARINEKVKRESGLIEVDAVYEKIAVIDREIAEEERAQRALRNLP